MHSFLFSLERQYNLLNLYDYKVIKIKSSCSDQFFEAKKAELLEYLRFRRSQICQKDVNGQLSRRCHNHDLNWTNKLTWLGLIFHFNPRDLSTHKISINTGLITQASQHAQTTERMPWILVQQMWSEQRLTNLTLGRSCASCCWRHLVDVFSGP